MLMSYMKIGLDLCFEKGRLDGSFYLEIVNKYVTFSPKRFLINHSMRKWDDIKSKKIISKCDLNENVIIGSDEGYFMSVNSGSKHPHRSISIVQNRNVFNPTNDEIDVFSNSKGFVSAYLYDEEYVNVQSTEFDSTIKALNLPLDSIKHTPYFINNTGFKEYDIRHNPGRRELIGYTWLCAAWKMWFGEGFYHLVAKEKVLSFPDAYEIKELSNGQVYIQLFEHVEDSATKEAQEKQWAWRRWLDFDKLVEMYP
jgi:hypothetical protein